MLERMMRSFGYEKRSAVSYTDSVIQAILGRAQGGTALPTATAAVEAAAGLVGRSFASATVSGMRSEALSAPYLAMVGRSLIRRGELLFYIQTQPGLALIPVQSYSITGGADPSTWTYELTLGAPSKSETKRVPIDGVVHLRYAADPERPWQGVSPLQAASISGRLGAAASAALADEAESPHGSFLPTPPADGDDDGLQSDVKSAKGGMLIVESMSSDWQSGGPAPRGDWSAQRFGFDAPQSLVEIERQIFTELLSACGIPPAMLDPTGATASREAYRQFLHATISPLGRIVETELREKLDTPDLSITWEELRAADIAGRARAFSSMVKAGMDLQQAASVSGVLSDGE